MKLSIEGATLADLTANVRAALAELEGRGAPRDLVAAAQEVWPAAAPGPVIPDQVGQRPPPCPIHMVERVYHPAGTNRQGKAISASYRCPRTECRGQTIWLGVQP